MTNSVVDVCNHMCILLYMNFYESCVDMANSWLRVLSIFRILKFFGTKKHIGL